MDGVLPSLVNLLAKFKPIFSPKESYSSMANGKMENPFIVARFPVSRDFSRPSENL
jgi:hypothetical protein